MISIRIRTLGFAFVVGALGCSSKGDASAARDTSVVADHTRADSVVRVVASDTSRLPANRLRLKITEDVPRQHLTR